MNVYYFTMQLLDIKTLYNVSTGRNVDFFNMQFL